MAFPRKLLNENEELVLDLRPHWLFLAPATIFLVLTLLLTFAELLVWEVGGRLADIASLAILAVALAYFGLRYAKWVSTMFVLTSDRLLTRRGVLSKSGIEIPLE